jgi:TIR domain
VARPRIFLNYRREDTRGYAGRLYDRLSNRFGEDRIFRDVDAIPPGIDYLEYVDRVVGQCDVMLVLIGETWSSVKDARGRRRLDDPRDLVRLEIAAGLERNIPVIPVLMQGASMPIEEDLPDQIQSLARRNALEMSDRHWNYDWDRLTQALDQLTRPTAPKRSYPKQPVDREGQVTPEPIETSDPTIVDIPVSGTGQHKRPIVRPVVVALATVLPLLLLLTAGYLVARNNGSQSSGDKQASLAPSPAPTGTRATTTSHGMKADQGDMTAKSAYPNAAERQLLTYVPAGLRRGCDRAPKPLPGATAAVRCYGNNLPSIQYNSFKSNDAMYRFFNSRVKWQDAHSGPCNTTTKASHVAKAEHDEMAVGSLLCYEHGGEARLEWTNKLIHVYTYSYSKSKSRHDLYHRVYQHAGPESHKKPSSHNG